MAARGPAERRRGALRPAMAGDGRTAHRHRRAPRLPCTPGGGTGPRPRPRRRGGSRRPGAAGRDAPSGAAHPATGPPGDPRGDVHRGTDGRGGGAAPRPAAGNREVAHLLRTERPAGGARRSGGGAVTGTSAADEPHYDVASYALGLFDDADATAFEEHLASCDGCAEDLESFLPVVALLPEARLSSADLTPRPADLPDAVADRRAGRATRRSPMPATGASGGGRGLMASARAGVRRPLVAAAAAAVITAGGPAGGFGAPRPPPATPPAPSPRPPP